MANKDHLIDETNLPEDLEDAQPAQTLSEPASVTQPSALIFATERTPGFFSGSMPPQLQLDSSFSRARVMSDRIPRDSLMPLGIQGNPSTNAAIQSTATKITNQAIAAIPAPVVASTDIDLGDGLTHGNAVWAADSAWVGLRDDFIRYGSQSQLVGNVQTDIGELGWIATGTSGPTTNVIRLHGGLPPNMGSVSWSNTVTSNQYIALMLNDIDGTATIHSQSFPLLDVAGWKMSWVFKFDGEFTESTSSVAPSFNKKSCYIGLMGSVISSVAPAAQPTARPDIFFGLRLDTSTVPAGMTVTSVAAGTGVYTGTFGGGGTNGFAGMNITFKGFANAANNGTFNCTASTTTTLTVANASSASETVTPAGSGFAIPASVPSTGTTGAASGGNTVYNIPTGIVGINANQLQGLTFVVSGFVASSGANNGTFICVANSTSTITLNNAVGVLETHAGFITGGSLGDTVMTLEAVENLTFASGSGTPVRHNIQGTTLAGPAPVAGVWHRLDIFSTTVGQVVIQLDGSDTYKLTATASAVVTASNGSGGALIETNGYSASYVNVVGYTNARNCACMPFSAGSKVTMSGLTGGQSGLNGTYILEATFGQPPTIFFPTTNNSGQATPGNAIVTGFPALTPVAIFGNDDTAAPYLNTRFFVDFFSLVWNTNLGPNAPGTPDPTKPRYW